MEPNNGEPLGIHEIVIHVRDIQTSLKFYQNILRFNLLREEEGVAWLQVGKGERAVQVLLHPREEELAPVGSMALAFQYDKVDAVVDRARKGGVVIEMEPTNLWYGWYGAREAALRDPDDTYIFLAEPLSERPRDA